MARDNYSYKKYQRELAKKKKTEEKKQRQLERKAQKAQAEAGPVLETGQAVDEGVVNQNVS